MIHNGRLHLTDDERSARSAREAAELRDFQEREAESQRRLPPGGGGSRIDDPAGSARRARNAREEHAHLAHESRMSIPERGAERAAVAVGVAQGLEPHLDERRAQLAAAQRDAETADADAAAAEREALELEQQLEHALQLERSSTIAGTNAPVDPDALRLPLERARRKAPAMKLRAVEVRKRIAPLRAGVEAIERQIETARSDAREGAWAAVIAPRVTSFLDAARDSFALLADDERELARQRIVHAITRGTAP